MVKSKSNKTMYIVGALIVIFLFLFQGGYLKNFSMASYSDEIQLANQNQDSSYTVGVHFTPNTVCPSDSFMAYVESNMPSAICSVYTKTTGDYAFLQTINLDGTGKYSILQKLETVGTAVFKVICSKNGKYSTSNEAVLTVNNCQGVPTKTCAQKANELGTYYTEQTSNCLNYATMDCQDKGKVIEGWAMDGTCCIYTCSVPAPVDTCTDTDGGQDDQFLVYGSCESSVTQSGTWDQCINNQLVESYCADDKTCQTTTTSCDAGQVCSAGKCVVATSVCAAGCDSVGYDSSLCISFNINGAVSMEQACANNNGIFANVYNACATGQICCCR